MRILITGGLGFIGGRLAIALSKNGHEIYLGTRRNLRPPLWLPGAKIQVIDWESDESLRKSCFGSDVVVHAAGMSAKDCELDPKAAMNFNGNATSKLLEAAISNKVKTFFYISSAHVYSYPLEGVIDENTRPTNPHAYATSHLEGEVHVSKAREKGLINSTILRLANAYGVPAGPEVNCWVLLVNDLCLQAVTARQLKLATSGVNLRNFITLTDVCAVISKLIDDSENQNLPQILNIGNTHSNTVHEMAELIQNRCKDILGFSPNILLNNEDSYEVTNSLDFKSLYPNLFGKLVKNDRNSEIDELLNFCQTAFDSEGLRAKAK